MSHFSDMTCKTIGLICEDTFETCSFLFLPVAAVSMQFRNVSVYCRRTNILQQPVATPASSNHARIAPCSLPHKFPPKSNETECPCSLNVCNAARAEHKHISYLCANRIKQGLNLSHHILIFNQLLTFYVSYTTTACAFPSLLSPSLR